MLDGDQLFYIIATQAQREGKRVEGVVGTEMSNLGVVQAFEQKGIPLVRAKVGDRYVMEALKERNWRFGAEPSGHIVCFDLTTTGDGIISALQVLAAMMKQQKTLHELSQEWQKFPQVLVNVHCAQAKTILQKKEVQQKLAQLEAHLGTQGRCLVRASGTEPVIRVMIEGKEFSHIKKLAEEFAETLQGAL